MFKFSEENNLQSRSNRGKTVMLLSVWRR